MNSLFSIRKLGLADLDEYIRLRREGIRLDPIGFGKAYATEDQAPRSLYAAFLSPSRTRAIWGAFCEVTLVGMIRLETEENGTRKSIYSLYICPDMRHHGLGPRLLRQAIEEAARAPLVAEVRLSVVTKNERALALYHSVGFRVCGIEENTFCVGGEYYSEYRMRKCLSSRLEIVDRLEHEEMGEDLLPVVSLKRGELEQIPATSTRD